MRGQTKRTVLLASHLLLFAPLAFAQTFPRATGRVNDFANVIDAATEAAIDQRLDQLEQQTSSEIAVATIPSLEGISVEEYANRLFKEWGVGRAREDNGVLVLVAPTDRVMKVEVGYGLEGVLPDGLAGQVIRDDFTPRFKDGDYSGGIIAGVNHLADIVQKHQVLTPGELAKLNEGGFDALPWIVIPFFGLFITIGFGLLGIGLRTKTGFPVLFGSLFGGIPLLMGLAFIGKLWLYSLFPLALLVFILGLRLGGRPAWRNAFREDGGGSGSGKGKRGSSSGWKMGSSSSSSSGSSSSSSNLNSSSSSSSGSSSSSSSSSSSFGGGSSGGGGASGRW